MDYHRADQVAERSHCVQLSDSDVSVVLTQSTVDDGHRHHADDDGDDVSPVVPPAQVCVLHNNNNDFN